MEDSILISHLGDLVRFCEKRHTPRFSAFLDEREQGIAKNNFPEGVMFGGYAEAERRIFGVFPEYCEADFPIKVLEIRKKYKKELTHRHFLGTILSLGIDRSKVGDILVGEEYTYVFLCEDIADFVADNTVKIAGVGVSVRIAGVNEVKIPERKYETIDAVAASLRLDAVISALLGISRTDAKKMIGDTLVSVNHKEETRADSSLTQGDLLSVRGFGRAELLSVGGKTRSDRLHITFKKYV